MLGRELPEHLIIHCDKDGFQREVRRELREEEVLLSKVKEPLHLVRFWTVVAIVLLAAAAIAIYLQPNILYLWVLVGILLYSYNFIIHLFPTTVVKARPNETGILRHLGKTEKRLAIKLVAKNKKLAAELGLTMFLGGMIPIIWSFTIIFGIGLAFALYFAAFNIIDWSAAFAILLQLSVILLFFLFLTFLQPESQGFTRFARSMKTKYREMEEKGLLHQTAFLLFAAVVALVCVVLGLGAILLPGWTISVIWIRMVEPGIWGYLTILFVVAVQLLAMRHFQSISSRRMAIRLVSQSLDRLRNDVIPEYEALCRRDISDSEFEMEFAELRRNYYSWAIYDIMKVDILGSSPVFLVGLRLKYLLDDKVLNHFSDKRDMPVLAPEEKRRKGEHSSTR